jgi:flavodoxin
LENLCQHPNQNLFKKHPLKSKGENVKEKKTDSSKCKGIIFYYSGSGNTKLACQYIIQNLNQIDVELFNMVKAASVPDLTVYDLVGFATFTDFGGAPFLFHEFMKQLPQQNDKLAFVFNTFGSFSLKTLKSMAKLAKARGFKVVEGHSLHTPESYIPLIVKGRGAETSHFRIEQNCQKNS